MKMATGKTIGMPACPPDNQIIHNVERNASRYMSNHVLINRVRLQKNLPKYRRSRYLDTLAQDYVSEAARLQDFRYSQLPVEELMALLGSDRVGQNLCRGKTMIDMHEIAMKNGGPTKANILSRNFVEMGMATARAQDGKLYMIQFFRGESDDVPSALSISTSSHSDSSHSYSF